MAQPGLKVSASSLSRASAGRANSTTLSRLQALDKNGDGQLDLDEVCDAIDEIVRKEKTERTLKWLLAALALFSLLTIAATVGLTYAVVVMSQDTQVDGSVLQSKDTGETLRTGSFLQSQNATALSSAVAASNDPGATLGRITSIKVPSLKPDEAYTVHKVDAVTMMLNGSMIARTATGLDVLLPGNDVGSRAVGNRNQSSAGPGRKLLADTERTYFVFTDDLLKNVEYKELIGLNIIQGWSNYEPGDPYVFDEYKSNTAFYFFDSVPDSFTIADVKAFFNNTTMVGEYAPLSERLLFTTTPRKSGGEVLELHQTLAELAWNPDSLWTLWFFTRPVSVFFSKAGGYLSRPHQHHIFPPHQASFSDVKREVKAVFGHDIEAQTIRMRVTRNDPNKWTVMQDTNSIVFPCINYVEWGWDTPCEMEIELSASVQT